MSTFLIASELPGYTGGQAVRGTAILLGVCLFLGITLAVAWWRRR
ncbi:hypothetical protein [Mycobacterium sp. 852013-50091_SCH5140682]|nr:hypothetical protein [Mycobacterium sp. 852013-50091_SCH5140682]